ncbi:MAG: DUF87 domain-containing protein [Dehalococcoidia bacterium]|nr:MAG: DUF87 domain-containing protein [Dehalococcoidia bacterium]
MLSEPFTLIGQLNYRQRRERFGILPQDRLRHMLIVGQTGTGKSTLIETMARSDMEQGNGLMVVDPHGDLIEHLLNAVPKHRKNDLVLLDPADKASVLPFNPLAERLSQDRSLAASAIIAAFTKTWPDFWGPRSEHLLRMALLALLESPGMSLLDLSRFLSDARWRESLSARVKDEVVRKFWQQEFAQQPERLAAESLAPLQNKVGALVGHPILRRILGQSKSRLRLEKVLSDGKILLINLSRGRIGLDACVLLGSLLLALFEAAVLARAHQSEAERKPFYLFVDEFSLFANPGFVALLSEGRKYGLGVTLAQQSLASLSPPLQADILTNAGTLVALRLGALDARLLAPHLAPVYTPDDLMMLPAHEFAIRMLIRGKAGRAFSGEIKYRSLI